MRGKESKRQAPISYASPTPDASRFLEGKTNGDSLARLRAMVFREQQTRWGALGFSPEWSFTLAPIEAEGENAAKYLATFFSKDEKPQRKVFLKQYHHPQIDGAVVENEFCGIQITHQAFQSTDRFRAPQPYSCRLGEKILFMEYCPSASLKKVLFRPLRFSRLLLLSRERERLLEYMIEAGRLLSHFQRIPVSHHPAGGTETAEGIVLRYEKQLLRHLGICRKGGFPEDLIQRIQSAVFHRLESQSPFPPIVLQHSDFAPWNLMVGDRHLYLTDFQNFTPGFASFDLAFFYCALDLLYRYRTVDGALLSRMQSVLVDAYLNGHEEAGFLEMKQPLPLFEAFRLMHMTYFAQSIFCVPAGSYYQSLYAVPFRRFLIEWFHQHLEDEEGSAAMSVQCRKES
ncbi:MAG: aminoglycoside phosphotransferase family protein [Candidatus Manganitrophus sp. SA1]|nr:aminoglycoside phosphotransferase family protein [Candidatus Manganitrophus morganii]